MGEIFGNLARGFWKFYKFAEILARGIWGNLALEFYLLEFGKFGFWNLKNLVFGIWKIWFLEFEKFGSEILVFRIWKIRLGNFCGKICDATRHTPHATRHTPHKFSPNFARAGRNFGIFAIIRLWKSEKR